MAYLGKTPSQAVRNRYYYTATGGETSLSGADDNSNVLIFADGNYVDVALNGVTLVAGTDYNTTTANTIAGLTALVASDVVEVIVYDTFSVFSGNVNGDFTVGGTLTAASYSGLPTTTLTSLGIPNHDDITVDAAGNVLIGDSAPQITSKLTVSGNGSADTGTFMYDGSAGTYFDINTNAANGTVDLEANARTGAFPPLTFKTGGTEVGRWDASGNLLVGKTSYGSVLGTGSQLGAGGTAIFTASSDAPALSKPNYIRWNHC
jgi:hypothetical protein